MRSKLQVGLVIGLIYAMLMPLWPAPLAAGQQSLPPDDLIIYHTEGSYLGIENINEGRAYFSVLDKDRKPVVGLKASDFTVLLNNEPVSDFTTAITQDPISVILVIDTSGSMKGKPLEQAQNAAMQFIDALGPDDEVAIFSFNKEVTDVSQGFTRDKVQAKNFVKSLTIPPEAWTCLYDAVYDAVTLAVKKQAGRRAIVVLSDGADIGPQNKPCSTHNSGDVASKAQDTHVSIYTIGLGKADQNVLTNMANNTGGQALIAPQPADLSQAFQDINSLLKDQYLLTLRTRLGYTAHLSIGVSAYPAVIDDDDITFPPPPPPLPGITPTPAPFTPVVKLEPDVYVNSVDHTMVFTATIERGESNKPIASATWYVDKDLPQSIADPESLQRLLVYNIMDGEKCLVGKHTLHLEVVNEVGLKREEGWDFEVTADKCPPAPPPPLPWWIFLVVALVAILALVGAVLALRRAKTQPVFVGDDPGDKTEDEAEVVGPVARLHLIGAQAVGGQSPFTMTTEVFRIGRGPDNDLRLDNKRVSRKHAEIHYNRANGAFTLYDRDSSGGTKVKGEYIKASSKLLTNGDNIEIGPATIRFETLKPGSSRGPTVGGTDDDRTEVTDDEYAR